MTTNIEKFSAAGTDTIWLARQDSNGYPAGITGSIAAGSDEGMYQMVGVQEIALQSPAANLVNIPFDDGPGVTFQFQPQENASGQATLGVLDVNVVTNAKGLLVYADGDWDTALFDPNTFTNRNFWLLANSQGQSRDSGSLNEAGYMVQLRQVSLNPRISGLSTAAGILFQYDMVQERYDTYPWGVALAAGNEGATAGGTTAFFSENRVTLHTYVSNGSTVTFTLDKTPAADNTNKVKCWHIDATTFVATAQTYNAATPTTGEFKNVGTTVTLGAAETSGDLFIVRYEYTQ